jgi:hypothetical protein
MINLRQKDNNERLKLLLKDKMVDHNYLNLVNKYKLFNQTLQQHL